MAIPLRFSTASQEVLLPRFLDSTDGDSEETGLTIANTDIKIWKNGGTTVASKNSGGATHISNGLYYCVLDATDTNTLGPLIINVHVSGALAVQAICEVLTAEEYDGRFTTSMAEETGVVSATANIWKKLNWMFAKSRNKMTQTSTTQILKADDGTTTIATSTVSDDGTTFTRGEFA